MNSRHRALNESRAAPVFGSVASYADYYAQQTPNAVAALDGARRITYEELARDVGQVQQWMLQTGVRHGERVAVLASPGYDYYLSLLAAIGIGAIWVGLNPRYRYDEIAYVVSDSRPCLVLYQPSFEQRDFSSDFERLRTDIGPGPIVMQIPQAGLQCLRLDSPERSELDNARSAVNEMDPAVVVYTSGSSGRPKGALLTHYGLIYAGRAQVKRWDLSAVRLLCFWPINHVGCVADTTITTLLSGGEIIFQPRFDAQAVLSCIAGGQVTAFLAVPTVLQMVLAHPSFSPDTFRSLELIVWGGAALPLDVIQRLAQIGPRLAVVYGMTEATANTTYTDENADVSALFESVGKPLAEFPCRIVREGTVCGLRDPGEIQFHGRYLTLGYLNRPEATREAFTDDGWYRSGDLGFWREDGNLQLVGRLKEMFKSGGYNVYPREVEIAIEAHPAVAQVCVVAIPDTLYQEVGAAFVVSKPAAKLTTEQLLAHCRDRLANYKCPKHFILTDALPTLPIGKVDKAELRSRAISALAARS